MKKNLTLLYIEDKPLIRQQAVEYLSRLYTTILEVPNGEKLQGDFLENISGVGYRIKVR